MGNGLSKAHLDTKFERRMEKEETKVERSGKEKMKFCSCIFPEKCSSFSDFNSHAFKIFPRTFPGIGVLVFQPLIKNGCIHHTASCDIWDGVRPEMPKSYFLDLTWHGSSLNEPNAVKEEPLYKSVLSHIALKATCDAFQTFSEAKSLNIKHVTCNYITDSFTCGLFANNCKIGNYCDQPNNRAKQEFGFEAAYSLTRSILLGCSVTTNALEDLWKMREGKGLRAGARLALPSNVVIISAVLSHGIGIDVGLSTRLIPYTEIGVLLHSSFESQLKNKARYGIQLLLPNEESTVKVEIDTNWQVNSSVKHKFASLPFSLVISSVFNPTPSKSYNYKLGFGAEILL